MTELWVPSSVDHRSNGTAKGTLHDELVAMSDVISKYELVSVGEHVIVVTEKKLAEPDMRELGNTGMTSYWSFARQDYNPELRGIQGLKNYDKMRRNDGQIRATLRLVKTPVLAARWYIEPGGTRKMDQTIADFVWDNLQKWMSMSWPAFLTEALLLI